MSRKIQLELTLPILRLGVGPFAIDPLEHLMGVKLSELLEPLMTGPRTERCTDAGVRIDVYGLALPDGEGASVPLGAWGELGFHNDAGILVLTLPALAAPWVLSRLGDAVEGRPEPVPSASGQLRRVALRVRPRCGACVRFPLGHLGEIGVEAVARHPAS